MMPRHCQRRAAATRRKTKRTKNGLPTPVSALTVIATPEVEQVRSEADARQRGRDARQDQREDHRVDQVGEQERVGDQRARAGSAGGSTHTAASENADSATRLQVISRSPRPSLDNRRSSSDTGIAPVVSAGDAWTRPVTGSRVIWLKVSTNLTGAGSITEPSIHWNGHSIEDRGVRRPPADRQA